MATMTGQAAKGKVTSARQGVITFIPSGTSYELHLTAADGDVPLNTLLEGVIRVTARKIWTVPSGGNFIAPIFGTPRIVQGRVRWLDETTLVVQAGAPIVVDLTPNDRTLDLANGPIAVGSLVNVTCLPGARFELAHSPAAT